MADLKNVEEFLKEKSFAIVGVSRTGHKFGNSVVKELTPKGFQFFPIHHTAEEIQGVKCYPGFENLPEKVGGVIISVKPAETEKVVRLAVAAGIKKIWIQNGAESADAIKFCEENDVLLVQKKCVLMFAEPTAFFHKLHRWIWSIGK